MGPVSAKSYPGRDLVRPQPPPAGRARQEIDYGRRGKGYIFGAFGPATGAAFTRPYPGRGTAHWVAFLEEVEGWLPQEVERVYAIVHNLNSHRFPDVLLFMLAHPRWEMVFQPKYAAYLNLIEPWWKVLRSLALAARRFETCDAVWEAVDQATASGTRTGTPSSRGDGAVTGRAVSPASRSCPRPRDLPDEPLIPTPADQHGFVGLGHQWKSVCGWMVLASRRRQRSATVAWSASSVAKCVLTTASSTSGQRCSAGCSSGV